MSDLALARILSRPKAVSKGGGRWDEEYGRGESRVLRYALHFVPRYSGYFLGALWEVEA